MSGAESQGADLALECVALGPAVRREGRDYGLGTRGLNLSDSAEVLLEDFALSLSEWAKRGPPPFEILFWLGDRDRQYALLKAAYLGRGGMGPIAVAQGVLIPEAAMAAIHGWAHRLLPLIPEPAMIPWEAKILKVDREALAAAPAAPAPESVVAHARHLATRPAPWGLVNLGAPESADESRRRFLNAVPWQRVDVRPSWTTSTDLPPIGRFSPAQISLGLTTGAGGRNEIRLDGLAEPLPPGFEMFLDIFEPPPGPETGTVSFAALDAMATPKWKPADYRGQPPHRIIVGAIEDILRQKLSSSAFWEVLGLIAANIGRLEPGAERDEAVLAITTLFSDMASPDPAIFARLLGEYIGRVWNRLPGKREQPLLWALERDVLGRLGADDVRSLVHNCLDDRLAARLAGMLEAQRDRDAGDPGRMPLAAARALIDELSQYRSRDPIDAQTVRLLAAAIGLSEALVRAQPSDPAAAGLTDAAAALGERLLTAEARGTAGWIAGAPRVIAWLVTLMRRGAGQASLVAWMADLGREIDRKGSPIELYAPDEVDAESVRRFCMIIGVVRSKPPRLPA